MKYIKVKNDGLIEPQALHLVGASTKREDKTKIGQFGSGNKYALAFFLRNNYELKIFKGLEEIPIATKPEKLKDHEFEVIYIDGEKTSITTEMGKDWKFWQAIREIYCNAMDEGGFGVSLVKDIEPAEGQTHFYIERKEDAVVFLNSYDNYFADNKEILFECEIGRILKKSGNKANIYRKGIRCFESDKTSFFDYDFNEIDIDENRLVKYWWNIDTLIWSLIFRCTDTEIIKQAMFASQDQKNIEGTFNDFSRVDTEMSEEFRTFIRGNRLAPSGSAGLLKADEVHQHIIIPTQIFKNLRGEMSDDSVGDNFKVTKAGAFYREVEPTELQEATIKKAMEFFKEVQYEINYPIIIAIFDTKEVMGYAKDGEIIVSDIAIEKGINDLCNTIIEEQIHLKYDVKDETREFQTAAISELVTYMKTNNSFVL